MLRRRLAPPPSPVHILEDSSSQLHLGYFKRVYDTTPSRYMVRYPRLDEPNPSQMDEGSLGIHYVSFEVGLYFPLSPFAKEWLCYYGIVLA